MNAMSNHTPATEQLIESADPQTLLVWSERVLTAAGIEQVIGD